MKFIKSTLLLLFLCQLGWAQYGNCLILKDDANGSSGATDADYLQLGDIETSAQSNAPMLTNYTVEFWMKAGFLYQYGPNFGAEQDQAAGLRFRFNKAGKFAWWTSGGSTAKIESTDAHKAQILSAISGEWVHVALTYEETDASAKTGTGILYLNGDSILSGNIPTPQDGFKGFRIGTDGTTSSNYMNRRFIGSIDEFSIWRTTRSKAQVSVDKSDVLDASSEGLLLYYNFDEVNESTVVNEVNPGVYNASIVKYDGNTTSSYLKSDLVSEAWLNAPLPQSFTTTIYNETFGDLNLELYKYNIRSEGLKIYTCRKGGQELTLYTDRPDTIEVRTYRGRITNLPNARVFASVYPDKKLYAKVYFGKGERDGFVINGAEMTMTPANIEPVTEMYKAHNHIKAGFTPDSTWFAKKNYDPKMAFAVINQAVNGMDYILARDLNLSMQLAIYVLPLDDVRYDKSQSPIWTNTFWYTYGSGGGAGRNSLCDGNKGGRTSIGDLAFGSFSHEFGHLLDFGHYHNQWDCMHSNMDWFGRDNSVKGRLLLSAEENLCTISEDNYMDPVHPYAAEDYFITQSGTPIEVDVLANDFDSNPGDVLSVKSFQAQTQEGGEVTMVDGILQYTPPTGFIGRDYFNYEVQSGSEANGTYLWNSTFAMVDVRDEDLALYYTFDESSGNIVVDRGWGISQNNGNIINGTFGQNSVEGKVGDALQLNGVNQCVEMPDVLDPLDNSLTVSLWFKLSSVPGKKESMLLFDTGSKGTLTAQGLSILVTQNAIGFYAQPEDLDYSGCQLTKSMVWETNRWYHAVMVVDREKHVLEAYLDTELLTNTDYVKTFKPDHIIKGYPGMISGRIASALGAEAKSDPKAVEKSVLNGALDELRIYTTALSAIDVVNLYGEEIVPDGSCPTGLFDNPILNNGFEADVVKHAAQSSSIDYGWFYSNKSNVKALWSGYSPEFVLAPEGDNWGLINNGHELYQQVGFLENDARYKFEVKLGKMPELPFSGLKISLWSGVTAQNQGSVFNQDAMTLLSESIIDAGFLGTDEVKSYVCELSTGTVVSDCTPVWLRIESVNGASGAVLIDDIGLKILDTTLPTAVSELKNRTDKLGALYYQNGKVSVNVLKEDVDIAIYSMQGEYLYKMKCNKGSVELPNGLNMHMGVVLLTKEAQSEAYKFVMP